MAHLHYCLECNQVVGESVEDCEVPQDHAAEVCQTCAQHHPLEGHGGESASAIPDDGPVSGRQDP